MSELMYKRSKWILLILFLVLAVIAAACLSMQCAPDEEMRYLLPQFMYQHGTLPNGTEQEIIHPIWGFSYALYPYLTSQISFVFMKLASIFSTAPQVLLFAARLVSVLSGFGTMFFTFKIGEKIFKEKEFALLLGVMVGFVPQFIFLCSYQNNDCFAVFTSALIIYCWVSALLEGWTTKICIILGIGCGLCMLSYYSAYIYCLGSLIIFFVTQIKRKEKGMVILKQALIILGIALAIAGWFFIRNYLIHDGDLIGRNTLNQIAELYAADAYKPSQIANPQRLGLSYMDTFVRVYPGFGKRWFQSVLESFIGVFGYMNVLMPGYIYVIYWIFLGAMCVIFLVCMCAKKERPFHMSGWFALLLLLMMAINLGLFMNMVYTSDFQAQGRYMMPSIIPLMIFTVCGLRFIALRKKKEKGASGLCIGVTAAWLIASICIYIFVFAPGCFA